MRIYIYSVKEIKHHLIQKPIIDLKVLKTLIIMI